MKIDYKDALTDQQMEAIDLMIQKAYNSKLTDQKIADIIGVSRQTLFNWRKIPAFNNLLLEQSREVSRENLASANAYVSRTLANPRAKESTKVKLVELIYKQHGELRDTVDVNANVKQKMTVDDIIAKYDLDI